MEFPKDLDINSLTRDKVINLLLASIGFEELALAHMVKAEAKLLRRALGKLSANGNGPLVNSLDDLLKINRSVNDTLQIITNKEGILLSKLNKVVGLLEEIPVSESCCSVTVETGEAVIDAAFMNDENLGTNVTVDKIDISIAENCTMENNRIDLRLTDDTCQGITITLIENTATILCNPLFNAAIIRAAVDVTAANHQFNGKYNALISVNDNGHLTIFLQNELNRFLFRISGASAAVENCLSECPVSTNVCECSVNITTNQNTTITITGDNVFFPATLTNVYIDVPCNCDAANSSISVIIREEFLQILIPGEFLEGTISTLCEGNQALISGSIILGDVFYNLSVTANQNGSVTATFAGASTFTITLTGANVVIGQCTGV